MSARSERTAAYASTAETLAKIHRLDFRAMGLADYGHSQGGHFGRQAETLARVAKKQVLRCSILFVTLVIVSKWARV